METAKNVFAFAIFFGTVFIGCSKDELERIPISDIPDMSFRNFLLVHFDTDNDGFISTKEAKAVKEIDLRGLYFNSYKGIEYFTSLEKLWNIGIGEEGFELDMSVFPELTVLSCRFYPTKGRPGLDLDKNVKLRELYFYGSYAQILNLKNNAKLETLDCSESTYLQTLILPESKRLKSLNCSNTGLKSVNLIGFELLEDFTFYSEQRDFSHSIGKLEITNSSVKRIFCTGVQDLIINNLPDLEIMSIKSFSGFNISFNHTVDLTKSTKIKSLTCEYLDCEINVSQCTALEELTLGYVGNKTLDLSKNTALKYLFLNGLENLDLDISYNTLLEKFHYTGFYSSLGSIKNNIALKDILIGYINTTLDFSNHTLLEYLYATGSCNIINTSNCKNLKYIYIFNNSSIKSFDLQQSNTLENVSLLSCNSLSIINLSGSRNLERLEIAHSGERLDVDISDCRNLNLLLLDVQKLNTLNASGCMLLKSFEYQPPYNNNYPVYWSLTNINMSNCTSLTSLSCNNNQLITLNVSGCSALTTLSCDRNRLTALDVNGCSALTSLSCNYNNLEDLNVGSCTSMNKLICTNNNLKELDLYSCLALRELFCYDNSDLKTLILNKNHQTNVRKDAHTQIVLKE